MIETRAGLRLACQQARHDVLLAVLLALPRVRSIAAVAPNSFPFSAEMIRKEKKRSKGDTWIGFAPGHVPTHVNALRAGKFRTPVGREIDISDNTPFYGYVVCDLSAKVKDWLHDDKDFKRMPDGLGYFHWRGNINLYIEVLSWSKVLKDADLRNRAFFYKLGIAEFSI